MWVESVYVWCESNARVCVRDASRKCVCGVSALASAFVMWVSSECLCDVSHCECVCDVSRKSACVMWVECKRVCVWYVSRKCVCDVSASASACVMWVSSQCLRDVSHCECVCDVSRKTVCVMWVERECVMWVERVCVWCESKECVCDVSRKSVCVMWVESIIQSSERAFKCVSWIDIQVWERVFYLNAHPHMRDTTDVYAWHDTANSCVTCLTKEGLIAIAYVGVFKVWDEGRA